MDIIFEPEVAKKPLVDKTKNQVNVIYPYRTKGGSWVYDDLDIPVKAEAFVCGSSELIDKLVGKDVNNFTAYISTKPLPKYTVKLTNVDDVVRKEDEAIAKAAGKKVLYEPQGWYEMEETGHRNWFCGHLLDYFVGYPKEIYVKIEVNGQNN